MPDDRIPEELRAAEGHMGLAEDVVGVTLPDEPLFPSAAHVQPATPSEWIKVNLFPSPFSSILTILFGGLALLAFYSAAKFVFVSGDWSAFRDNVRSYMVGPFPFEELWRIWTAIFGLGFLAGLTYGITGSKIRWSTTRRIALSTLVGFGIFVFSYVVTTATLWLLALGAVGMVIAGTATGRRFSSNSLKRSVTIAWFLSFPALMILLRAFDGVPPRLWGGFVLNIIVAVVAITLSFPIGLLLALGRRSSLRVVRYVCVGVIELVRGNPLYILLISGAYLLPLLLPPQMSDIPLIIRAMGIYVIFSSAYVAEIVRGGLQGVDNGQYEASRALGLPTTRMMALVILPQALRATIPAMISHFISLFKDTSLLAVVGGFSDALRTARRASAGLGQAGNSLEALLPAAALFFIVAFSMSRWSQRLERRLGVGER